MNLDLIVTTKANGNDIDVFGVQQDGSLSASPVVNPEPGTVPFAITFDPAGHLVIAETGLNALATYAPSPDGTVTLLDSAGTGQSATCWVAPAGGLLFASNAGSATISGYSSDASGQLALLGQTATDPGTADASATPGGSFLYVQTGGNGIIDEFAVHAGGLAHRDRLRDGGRRCWRRGHHSRLTGVRDADRPAGPDSRQGGCGEPRTHGEPQPPVRKRREPGKGRH